ncbi:MAG: protein-glutamate O-methyltransferase CheR [Actinomycetes bacterium]
MDMTLTRAEFGYVQRLVADGSGWVLADGKDYLVEALLRPIAEGAGLESVAALIDCLPSAEPALRTAVLEAMAINETYFFRDVRPFDALREVIIPEILAANGGRRLAIWSAAVSTGQEPYSLAMLVSDSFSFVPFVTILGTDFSSATLQVAKQGLYSNVQVNRGLPADLLVRHFHRVGLRWQVNDRIRQMVTFRQLNLIRPFPPLPQQDIILLRNVLTYFDPATKAAVLGRIATVLRPGGYLFMGGAETTYGIDPAFESVPVGKTICYQYRGSNGANGTDSTRG